MTFLVRKMPTGKNKAVLFDLGWTLMRTAEPPEIIRRILQAHGVTITLDAVSKVHSENLNQFNAQEMAASGVAYWLKWNLRILDKLGVRENREFLTQRIDEL
jgi:hypothetical protein